MDIISMRGVDVEKIKETSRKVEMLISKAMEKQETGNIY